MATVLLGAEPQRLERALNLLRNQRVRRVRPGVWSVESQTWPGCTYLVREDGGCACPDATYRHKVCKHALAAHLAQSIRPGIVTGRIDLDGEPYAF